MHVHLPKPLHGWRAFAGEVGIIVIGVLIALGAEQGVEDIHSRAEVKETRTALDAELAHNLAAFQGRLRIEPCVQARLAELERILDREPGRVPLRHALESALTINLEFAVWDAATGEARSLIPLKPKLQYAQLYDVFRHYERLRDRESDQWAQLTDLDLNTQLSTQEVKQAKVTIKRMRRLDQLLPAYASYIERSTGPLGIQPDTNVDAPARALMESNRAKFCSRLM
jgi:hypothetical protein